MSPDGVRYRTRDDSDDDSDDRRDRRSNYRVEVDDDRCYLTIRRMAEEDEGPWEVHVEDDRGDEEMRYPSPSSEVAAAVQRWQQPPQSRPLSKR